MSVVQSHATRGALLTRGLPLELLTVGWNLIEGTVAIVAALASGSVALFGFGVDSFVESTLRFGPGLAPGVREAATPTKRPSSVSSDALSNSSESRSLRWPCM